MTHEELVASIERMMNHDAIFMKDALLAVVELHKPSRIAPTSVRICKGCMTVMIWERCPTIKAIEKELA
jgi:hypothetical protein